MKKRLTAERRNEIAQLLLKNGNMKASSWQNILAYPQKPSERI